MASGAFTGLAAGSYSVTVLDDNNCADIVAIVITEPTPVVGAILSQTDPLCFGGTDGMFEVEGSGGTPSFQYDLGSGPQVSGGFSGQSPGTHSIDIIDANGCIGSISVILSEPTEILGSIDGQTDASCSGIADATADVSASGGIPPYTYDIGTGPQASGTFIDLLAGTYSVTIEDNHGCTSDLPLEIYEPVSLTAAIVTQTAVSCFGGTDGTVEISAQDGTGPYTFDIGSGPQTTGTFNGLNAGNHAVTVADANGCSVIVDVVISEPSELTSSIISQTDLTCFGSNDGAFDVAAANATPTYTYDIGTGPQATGAFTGLLPSTYTVNILDANSCATSIDVTISEPAPLVIDAGVDQVICDEETATLNATGADSYSWTPIADLTDPNIGSPDFNGSQTTTLTVTGIDSNGCVATDNVTITVNILPSVSAGADEVICIGSSIQISASGADSYIWDSAANLDDETLQNPTFSGTSTETLTVTGTDGNGCVNTDDVTITVNLLPSVDAGPDVVICAGTSVQLNATGGSSYSWSPTNSMNNYAIPDPTFSGLATTTYTVTSVDANGCTASDEITITVNTALPVNAGVDSTICDGATIQLIASGASTYTWWPTTDLDNANVANPVFSGSSSITYTVTGTDVNGCTNTDDISIIVNPLPIVDAGTDQVICFGETAMLTATGGTSYVWSPAVDLDNANIASPTFSGTATTLLTVSGTDANGCVNTDDVHVSVNALPMVDAGTDAVICLGATTQLQASGGVSYAWTPSTDLDNSSISNPIFSGTSTTTLTVTATDANGCSDSDDVNITVNGLPVADAGADVTICDEESVQLLASGGAGYSWLPATDLNDAAIANPTFSGSATTTYTVTVTNGNGCQSTDDVTVTVNPLPVIDAGSDEAICIGDQLQLNASGGLTYAWSPASDLDNSSISDPLFDGLSTTTLTVVGTDGNGCSSSDDVIITVNPLPIVSAGTDQTICAGQTANLSASGATSYVWSPAADLDDEISSTPVFSGLTTTDFTVTGTDSNGCVNTADVTVTVNQLPAVDAGVDQAMCEGESVQLNVVGNGTVIWFPGGSLSSPTISDPIATPSATQEYVVHLTDAQGCLNTDTVIVTVMINPTAVIVANQEACETEIIDFESASIGNIVTQTWVLGDGNTESSTAFTHNYPTAGSYQVVLAVTTDEGCSDASTQTIDIHPNPTASFTVDNACLIEDVNFTDQSSVPTGSIASWDWDFGDSSTSSDQNPSHNYVDQGTFSVVLLVETDHGCADSITNPVTVYPMPMADFTFTNACADAIATITDISTIPSGSISAWQWVVNQTDTINGQFPYLGIMPVGIYSVELTVTSDNGCSNSITQDLEIYPLPVADFSANVVCQGLETEFTDLSAGAASYPITDWNWMIDGVQPDSVQNPVYSYPTYGNNLAVLEVTNSAGCVSQISQNDILVHPAPNADFSFTSLFCENDSVFFTDQSSVPIFTNDELISWDWTFDSIGSASGQTSNYTFSQFGDHQVILTIETNNGCIGTDTQTVAINPLPVAIINANIFEGCQILPVQFTSLSTIEPGYYIAGWEWNFGDGSDPVFDQHPGHDFMGAEPGDTSSVLYDISLTVTSSDGCVSSITMPEYITVHANPTALYEANFYVTDLNDPIFNFTDLSSENVVDWDWDFGDGNYSYDQNPQHTYADTGTYPIMLTVTTINGCSAFIRDDVRVNPVFTFYIPNSFTPNGDGVNDFFFGQGMGYKEYNMMVYNRWGEEIFESHDDEYHWDGSFKGQQVEQSVYVYKFIIYDWQNHQHIFTDGVTLHR